MELASAKVSGAGKGLVCFRTEKGPMQLECSEQWDTVGKQFVNKLSHVIQGLEGHGEESDFILRAVGSH